MTSADAPVAQSKRNVSSFFVWVFAFVGFLAALVQVADIFKNGQSQLQVKVTAHNSVVQKMLSDAVGNSLGRPGFAVKIIEEDKKFFCGNAASVSLKDKEGLQRRCKEYEALEAVQAMVRMNDGENKFIDYEIQNTGTDAARQIKLTGDSINLVEITQKGAKARQLDKVDEQGFYIVPDMNPGEETTVRVWTTDFRIDPGSEYLDLKDLPQLTFAGGKPSISFYRLAPEIYADAFETLNEFWTPISVLLVLVLCTGIGTAVIIILSVLSALMTGKPVRDVFEKPTPEKCGDGSLNAQHSDAD